MMKKIIFLIPIFNDWESFKKLIIEINEKIRDIDHYIFDCCVINDGSTSEKPKLRKPKNFNSLKIFNMKINKGHARCNAFGIRYLYLKEEFDYLILMDGDGEDRADEIKSLIDKIKSYPENSIVAKRVKRSEGPFFRFLYSMHKLITFFFTGREVNFGNFSCINRKDIEKIVSKKSLWSSYSGTIKKYLKNLISINSIRGVRYYGPSKMSLLNLFLHSFSIIAVFKYQVLLRSIILILILEYLATYLGLLSLIIQILLFFFTLIIFLISLREKKEELFNSHENLKNVENILH